MRKITKLGFGGSLSSVADKVQRCFLPKEPIREGEVMLDKPGQFTLLAAQAYPLFFALIRSLQTDDPPVLVEFELTPDYYQASDLYLMTADGCDQNNREFRPVKLPQREFSYFTARDRYSPVGRIQGGLVVGKIPMASVKRILVGKILKARSPGLEEILKYKKSADVGPRLWSYLLEWSFIETHDQIFYRLRKEFFDNAESYSLKGFSSAFCRGSVV